jgi:hypothetical protein
VTLENQLYMKYRAKYRAFADTLNYLNEAQKDKYAHDTAEMLVSGKHLLAGKRWDRGASVLK